MNVDHEFGAAILSDAVNNGYITAMSTEKSKAEEFKREHGGGVKPFSWLTFSPVEYSS
jgi:hypothetical protein